MYNGVPPQVLHGESGQILARLSSDEISTMISDALVKPKYDPKVIWQAPMG